MTKFCAITVEIIYGTTTYTIKFYQLADLTIIF